MAFGQDDDDDNVLEPKAFDKMIVRDITYAIVGEQTPTSGVKLDISKPEATVSGVFERKDKLVALIGFDFKGGITDRNFSIFKGFNSFNTAFEARTSFHIIPARSSASYGTSSEAAARRYVIGLNNTLLQQKVDLFRDTFYVAALIRRQHLGMLYIGKSEADILPTTLNDGQKRIFLFFGQKLFGWDGSYDLDDGLVTFLHGVPQIATADGQHHPERFKEDVITLYDRYKKIYDGLSDWETDQQIANAATVWTAKKYWWFTISPVARTEKMITYRTQYDGKDSLYFKTDYQFYYGATAFINHYIVYPNKVAHFIRLGFTGMHTNNLTSLSSYNYETRSPIFSTPKMNAEKVKSGSAYNYNDIKNGFASQLSVDYYLLPLNTLVPGLYASSSLNYSKLYQLPGIADRADDKTQISLEGGLVFNINSREKDKEKSLLSFLFYVRSEDLTDKRRTDITTGLEESRDDFLGRNLSFGVRVGIPITLPQRK